MRMETEWVQDQSRWQYAVASSLLVIAAAVFLATLAAKNPGFWILLARASSEAALVGGFADWFAVTALFRRPFGLPIPHTAVVPQSKDRIGEGLAVFFEQNFLTPEIMSATLRSVDPARRLADWLANKRNADELAEQVLRLLPRILAAVDDRDIRAFFSKSVHSQLNQVDLGPLLGRTVEELAASGYHGALLDDALRACKSFLEKREGRFEELVAERHRGWIRKTVDRQIARAILHGIEDFLDDLMEQGGAARQRLLQAIEERARAAILARSDRATLEQLKSRLLENPEVQALFASLWDKLQEAALEDLVSPSSKARPTISKSINSIGHALANDVHMREKLNGTFEALASELLPWREELAKLIAGVVKQWDTNEFSNRIETAVGSDLQYIRINGTIVGAAVGCVLYLGEAALQ